MRRFSTSAWIVTVVALGLVALAGLQIARFTLGFDELPLAHALLGPPGDDIGRIEHVDARSGAIDYALIDARIERLMEDPAMTGLAVAVIENGEIAFARGYGETLRNSGEPVTPETVFRWASLSKGVAATMLALLAEDGLVRLDAPVGRYAPSLRLPFGGHMHATVEDLLSHRLGIVRNAWDSRLESNESPLLLRLGMSQLARACVPGTCYRYQNVAFDAASEIVEEVSGGRNYETAVRDRLLRPLGMATASVSLNGLQSSDSWARSHSRTGAQIEVVEPYYRVPAAGGMNGSILDLAIWLQAQMGAAPEVVPPSVIAAIHAPRIRTLSEDRRMRRYEGRLSSSFYALGWRLYDYAGHQVIGHRGAVRGYRSAVLFDPVRKVGVAVLSNSDSGRPFHI
ncbi:MAG: beta-lactamase family protein, partial [Sphingomonadales bacterium]|nr:beta-lactamase family protein [Sphingomonadales bacterium]